MRFEPLETLAYNFSPDFIYWNILELEDNSLIPAKEFLQEISSIVSQILAELLPTNEVGGREISFFLLPASQIKELKKELFSLSIKTDVISIPLFNGIDDIPVNGYYLLGEIYLCPEVICENSLALGLDFWGEFFYIVIHGILHLLGYSDGEKEAREEMFELQDKLWHKYLPRLTKWVKS